MNGQMECVGATKYMQISGNVDIFSQVHNDHTAHRQMGTLIAENVIDQSMPLGPDEES